MRRDQDVITIVGNVNHVTRQVQLGQRSAVRLREAELLAQAPGGKLVLQLVDELLEIFPRFHRDGHAVRMAGQCGIDRLGIGQPVDLVEDNQGVFAVGFEFTNDLFGRRNVFLPLRMAQVDNMDQ